MDGERNGLKAKVPFHPRRRINVYGLPLLPPNNQGEKDDLHVELWHACAGPSVYVPRAGEKVLYFPQGHIEQLDACMNQDGIMEMPIYNLPSKILCRVMHVQLKVEPGTDEVFAQITLIPEAEQDEESLEHRNYQPLPQKAYPVFFSKKLTPSDTSTHGGFSIPKRHVDDGCLPPLDMSQQTPQQELVAIDLHGFEWRFRHIYRAGENFHPERVCPWNIEPTEFRIKKRPSILHNQKKARTDDVSSPGFPTLLMDGMWSGSIKYESQSSSGVLQGQEDSDTDGNQPDALRKPLPHCLPLNHSWDSMQQPIQNQREIGAAPFSGGQEGSISEPRNENETSWCEPNEGHACMLFGVNLVNGPLEPPSPQLVTSSELESHCSIPPTSQSTVSKPSKGTSSKQCDNCCSASNWSCTKVLKHGTALGRSVDITRFGGYKDLISELDRMFDFNGRLIDGSSGWHVTFTDDEGEMRMIGDHYPWQKFQNEVRRMLINPKEEIGRVNQSSLMAPYDEVF
ncbi:hypothetical protein GOBAR_DD31079 [Gossypium barbadense]|nr:hypothetical protein GOBAR_DD31079 [Gossypium barbadense]